MTHHARNSKCPLDRGECQDATARKKKTRRPHAALLNSSSKGDNIRVLHIELNSCSLAKSSFAKACSGTPCTLGSTARALCFAQGKGRTDRFGKGVAQYCLTQSYTLLRACSRSDCICLDGDFAASTPAQAFYKRRAKR